MWPGQVSVFYYSSVESSHSSVLDSALQLCPSWAVQRILARVWAREQVVVLRIFFQKAHACHFPLEILWGPRIFLSQWGHLNEKGIRVVKYCQIASTLPIFFFFAAVAAVAK